MLENKKLILVADDESEIRNVLNLLLTGEGYAVISVQNGLDALEKISADVDLCILDVNMPGMSGFMTAAEIRKQFDTPIIFLTAYSGESDKVMGFAAGADDYIVKPFSNMELLMRVKAILRRTGAQSSSKTNAVAPEAANTNQIHILDVIIDCECNTVYRNGESVQLTFTEFKILELLAKNRKKIFSLDNIYESIWDDDAVSDASIMVHIKNLRKKLGDSSREPKYIKTAWGRGYYID